MKDFVYYSLHKRNELQSLHLQATETVKHMRRGLLADCFVYGSKKKILSMKKKKNRKSSLSVSGHPQHM